MQIYTILVQWYVPHKKHAGGSIKTKWVEVNAPDGAKARELALASLPSNLILPGISMFWPKTEWRNIRGIKTLVHLFTDCAKVWQGDTLGWKTI